MSAIHVQNQILSAFDVQIRASFWVALHPTT
jgi:hypothetical protein